ncbi:RNA polymerase sigma factor [Modestobacter sp. SYSU DS0875]
MTADRRWGRRADPTAEQRMLSVLDANAPDLLAYFERRVQPVEDAADLLGETMLTAWRRHADLPDDAERARMWLFVTARNVLANHGRAQRRKLELADRLRAEVLTQHRAVGAGSDEPAEAAREAIGELPAELRELVTLVHWDGFSLTEAAEMTGIPASTARSRYAAARRLLSARLLAAGDDDADRPARPGTPVGAP